MQLPFVASMGHMKESL